jgi:hypothetical protein
VTTGCLHTSPRPASCVECQYLEPVTHFKGEQPSSLASNCCGLPRPQTDGGILPRIRNPRTSVISTQWYWPVAAATRLRFHDSSFDNSRNPAELFPALTVLEPWKTLFSYQTSLPILLANFSALSRNLRPRSNVPVFDLPAGSDYHRPE